MARPKEKAIGTPANTMRADQPDEEDQQVEVAERRAAPAAAATSTPMTTADHGRAAPSDRRQFAGLEQPHERRCDHHEPDADRQRRGAPGVGDLERRRGDRRPRRAANS